MPSARVDSTRRAMWLLNHTSARKFEIPALKRAGISEIFLPKSYPNDPNFRSASTDFSEDANLSIPADDLAVLNETDWHRNPSIDAIAVANKYFDIIFALIFHPATFSKIAKNFQGAVLYRTYGQAGGNTYSRIIGELQYYAGVRASISHLGERFWFAQAYPHLHEIEDSYLARRAIYLPLGMGASDSEVAATWLGTDDRLFFVCPDINFNPAYSEIYKYFKKAFGDIPHAIGGSQATPVNDPNVLGYLPYDQHIRNMQNLRVMFYHSQEPTHVHYHPFEAVAAGMPLVFMAGGILDRMGGARLPGRSRSVREARQKVLRILGGDQDFIETVRRSQGVLLHDMQPSRLQGHWNSGIQRILSDLDVIRAETSLDPRPVKRPTLAILASPKKMDAASKLAETIATASGQQTRIVFGLAAKSFMGRAPVKVNGRPARPFTWRAASQEEGKRVLAYGGASHALHFDRYFIPDDGVEAFCECDVWIVFDDDLVSPVLPIRPLIAFADAQTRAKSEKRRTDAVPPLLQSLVADAVLCSDRSMLEWVSLWGGVPKEKVHPVDDAWSVAREFV